MQYNPMDNYNSHPYSHYYIAHEYNPLSNYSYRSTMHLDRLLRIVFFTFLVTSKMIGVSGLS